MNKTYVVYKEDDIVAIGSLEEVSSQLGVKPSSIQWLTYPSAKKRPHKLQVEVVCDD